MSASPHGDPEARSRLLAARAPDALRALLRGLETRADEDLGGLREALVIMCLRLVFLWMAGARGLLDGALDPDALYRALLRGDARDGGARIRAWSEGLHRRRGGVIFDPARVEARLGRGLPDEALAAALRALFTIEQGEGRELLAGDALPVEHLGAVYEHLRGWSPRRLDGPALAVGRDERVVELAALLAQAPARRSTWFARQVELGRALRRDERAALARAETLEALADAAARIEGLAARRLPPGAYQLALDPRRRDAGAHYTPPQLCARVVQTTLAPLLAALGPAAPRARLLELRICDPALGCGAFLLAACRALERASDVPSPVTRLAIAERCLHGVDLDPLAVRVAALSLWIECGARDRGFGFLDHALRDGDALVGLTRRELAAALGAAADDRARARLIADGLLLTRFETTGERAHARLEGRRRALAERARAGDEEAARTLQRAVATARRSTSPPLRPFHWALEFPQVFEPARRAAPGFDAVIGNPPFLAGIRISGALSRAYLDFLRARYPGGGGQADLVAYFFRRGYALLRPGGALGLLATNTVAQGDTREAGLEPLCCGEGLAWGLATIPDAAPEDSPPATLFAAERRIRWPGAAVVHVSAVHMVKGPCEHAAALDGRPVPRITAFLLAQGGHRGPARLPENAGRAFKGLEPYADGFVFEDGNPGANPIARMRELFAKEPRARDRVFPYLGGLELNRDPAQAPSRYVLHFSDMTLEQAREWPAALALVERRVKPSRAARAPAVARWPWWRFWRDRPELRRATRGLARVLALADTSKHLALAWVPARYVLNKTLVVIAMEDDAGFALLQSRVHEVWARRFGSSMKDDLRYTASDCFETFPFPPAWERDESLAAAGREYHERRAALMRDRGRGLTWTYNAFHSPETRDAELEALRRLHAALDDATLRAYGWEDLAARVTHEFQEAYAVEATRRRRPWRLWWPTWLRDEVLARLLALNRARAGA